MALRHLQDKEIQDYLDGNISRENHWISIHLENCEFCKDQLKIYQKLYVGLKKDIDFSLPTTFSNAVIAKIQGNPGHAFKVRLLTVLFSLLGLIIGLGATYYFTGTERLLALWKSISETQKHLNLEWVATISDFLSGLNLNLGLLGFAVLIVLAISTIDHFIMRSKNKLASIFR